MLDKNSPISLYNQLINILVDNIKNNLNPHDKILSEREISDHYHVSRTTVRSVLQELENIGYIYKVPGKGTFVADFSHTRKNSMDNYSFTDQMRALGKVPRTQVLAFEIVESYTDIAEKMNLTPSEQVYYLKRLRLADDVPMMVEVSYIPTKLFRGLTRERISTKPLYEIFREDYHQEITRAEEEFSASLVTPKEAELLEVPDYSSCLKLNRKAFNAGQQVLELTLSTARSDKFVYKVEHTK